MTKVDQSDEVRAFVHRASGAWIGGPLEGEFIPAAMRHGRDQLGRFNPTNLTSSSQKAAVPEPDAANVFTREMPMLLPEEWGEAGLMGAETCAQPLVAELGM